MVFLKEFFKKLDFEKKKQQTTKLHEKFPSRQRVKVGYFSAFCEKYFYSHDGLFWGISMQYFKKHCVTSMSVILIPIGSYFIYMSWRHQFRIECQSAIESQDISRAFPKAAAGVISEDSEILNKEIDIRVWIGFASCQITAFQGVAVKILKIQEIQSKTKSPWVKVKNFPNPELVKIEFKTCYMPPS